MAYKPALQQVRQGGLFRYIPSQRQQYHRDRADRHAKPLSAAHFFLEDQKREHRHDAQSAHADQGVDQAGRQIGRGHQNRHQVENQIANARANGYPSRVLEHWFCIGLVASQIDDQIQQRAQPHGKQHQHIAVLTAVLHLLRPLDDRAARVAEEGKRHVKKPLDGDGFFLVALGIHAERDGADHQNQSKDDQNGQRGVPEDQSPDGGQDQREAVEQRGQRRGPVLQGLNRAKLASRVASGKQDGID